MIECMYNITLSNGESVTFVGFGIYEVMDNLVNAGYDQYEILSIECVDVM
jgi:hypothetical protein